MCKSAEFLHTPLEQEKVYKEQGNCDQLIYTHFTPKPILHFTFLPETAPLVRQFIDQLDTYASNYDLEESKDFMAYPISHDTKHETLLKSNSTCSCDPIQARNQYLDN
jgi:hypothetical protein